MNEGPKNIKRDHNSWEIIICAGKGCVLWFDLHLYTEPKWNIYTFIIKIANTISNECISLCLYKIGHVGNNMS